MATSLVLARISAWERSGAIDHALADRLRALEASEPEVEPAPATARVPSSGFILEFFAYLGGLFVLLAWYAWFLLDLPEPEPDRYLSAGVAALVPALALGLTGWALARRDDARVRRAAAVALAVAVPNAGAATWFLVRAISASADDSLAFLAGTVVALVVAVGSRVRRPSAITQAALLGAWGAFGLGASSWAHDVAYGPGGRGAAVPATLLHIAHVLWWWLLAAVAAVVAIRRPDRAPGHEGRATVTRIGVGAIAVLGTWIAALATESGMPVFEPWVAAGLLLLVGVVFIAIARWSGSRIHLITAGVAIVVGLTYLNVEFVAGPAGIATALLVEGTILLGVTVLGWLAGRFVGRRRASGAGRPPATS